MPLTKVGLLDEHGPSLVLSSYSHECIADWIANDADLLRNALRFFRAGSGTPALDAAERGRDAVAAAVAAAAAAGAGGSAGAAAAAAAAPADALGRLDGTHFLPVGHGGVDMTYSFNFWLPPPYRVVLLAALGLACYASNLRALAALGLDPASLPNWRAPRANKSTALEHERLPQHRPLTAPAGLAAAGTAGSDAGAAGAPSATATRARATAASALAVLLGLLGVVGWLFFRLWVDGSAAGDPFGTHAQLYQGLVFFGALAIALWPGRALFGPARRAFLRALARSAYPSVAQRIGFGDVMLADSLTSFAKVFGDVWLSACFLWPRAEHHTWWNGKGSLVVPFFVSIPYLIRLRQCLSEYATSAPTVEAGGAHAGGARLLTHGSSGAGSSLRRSRKPLANALKYASALPVIWLSPLHEAARDVALFEMDARVLPPEQTDSALRKYADLIFQLWLLSVFVNATFSFWWDVTNDWGLDLLRISTWSSAAPALARGVRHSLHKRAFSRFPTPHVLGGSRWRSFGGSRGGYSQLGGAASAAAANEAGDVVFDAHDEERHKRDSGESVEQRPKSAEKRLGEEGHDGMRERTGGFAPSTPAFELREDGGEPVEPSLQMSRVGSLRPPGKHASVTTPYRPQNGGLHAEHQHRRHPSALILRSPDRGHAMLFHPMAYQVIVVLDLILRFLWSLKLSSHLHHVVELEAGVFALEALEIIRRWAWVFLRVEWEFVKQRRMLGAVSERAAAATAAAAAESSQTSTYAAAAAADARGESSSSSSAAPQVRIDTGVQRSNSASSASSARSARRDAAHQAPAR